MGVGWKERLERERERDGVRTRVSLPRIKGSQTRLQPRLNTRVALLSISLSLSLSRTAQEDDRDRPRHPLRAIHASIYAVASASLSLCLSLSLDHGSAVTPQVQSRRCAGGSWQ